MNIQANDGLAPPSPKKSDAQRCYDALKIIARGYQTSEQLRRNAGQYGLSFMEELEGAYDNIQALAERTIKGKRRPK